MGGDDSKTVDTHQSSVTDPYGPTKPLLSGIIGSLGGVNTATTPQQAHAIASLSEAAGGLPNFGGAATKAVNNAFSTDTMPQQGMLGQSYQSYINNLGSTASGNELDPYKTPGFSDSLKSLTEGITNNVKGVYAGSGRDPTGAGSFAGSLGKGLMQGEAPIVQAQYNQNKQNQMDAASKLFQAGGATASGLTQQQLAALNAQFQGISGGAAIPGLLMQPAQAEYGAANLGYNQPLQNIGAVEGLVNPIASLGGSTEGDGTQKTTQSKSLMSNIIGGAAGLAGLNGAMGSGWLSSAGSSLGGGLTSLMSSLGPLAMFSDEDLKENIEPVGMLHDGQTVYSYNYKGENVPQIGLLAQEVEEHVPEAVIDTPSGFKAVRYDIATKPAREIGFLKMAA